MWYPGVAALTPWEPPRLLSIPAFLVLGGVTSFVLLRQLEDLIRHQILREGLSDAADLARQRTRSVASFIAINIFFWFADPTLGSFSGIGGQIVRSIVLVISAIALGRAWNRTPSTYRRESTSASLRKQLEPLVPQLSEALDGRSLAELSPTEVFTLARVLPAHLKHSNVRLYRNVVDDLFRTGRLDRASAFLQLEELRHALGLREDDHHGVIRELALLDPALLQLDARQRQARDVREAAAKEAIADLLEGASSEGFTIETLSARQRQRLERIRRQCGLEDGAWNGVLASFASPTTGLSPLVERELEWLEHALSAREALRTGCSGEPLLAPLLVALDHQMVGFLLNLLPSLQGSGEDPMLLRWQRLRPWLPAGVEAQLCRRGYTLPAVVAPTSGEPPFPATSLADVLSELWQDPDPETAAWSLWVLQRHAPDRAAWLVSQPRLGLPPSRTLEALGTASLKDELPLDVRLRRWLANDPEAAELTPAGVLERAIARPLLR